MQTLRRIKRGLGYIEGYGEHPGLRPFVLLASMGFCFGLICGIINGLLWFALLCYGAYARAKEAGIK